MRYSLLAALVPPILVLLGALVYIEYRLGMSALRQTSDDFQTEAGRSIERKIAQVLSLAPRLNQMNVRLAESGEYDLSDLETLLPALRSQAAAFDQVDSLWFARADLEFVGVAKSLDGTVLDVVAGRETEGAILFKEPGPDGRVHHRRDAFPVDRRPWFQLAVRSDGPVWGRVFKYWGLPRWALPNSVRMVDDEGRLVGVWGSSLFLDSLEDFLLDLDLKFGARAAVVESDEFVIADSQPRPDLDPSPGHPPRVSDRPILAAAIRAAPETGDEEVIYEGEHFWTQVHRYRAPGRLDWKIVVSAPETVLRDRLLSDLVWLLAAAFLAPLLLFLFTHWQSWRLVRRISALRGWAREVEAGRWPEELEAAEPAATPKDELTQLKASFQAMAGRLRRTIRQLEDEVERSEESAREIRKLAAVARNTDNLVIVTGADGRIEWVNESFEEDTGYALDEVAGFTPGEILQGPETDSGTVETIRRGLERREHTSVRILNYRKSGEKVWLDVDIDPVYDHEGRLERFIGIQRDVTAKIRAEEEALKWRDVFRQARWPIATADGDETVFDQVNPAFERLYGYAPGELDGAAIGSVYAAEEHARLPEIADRLQTEELIRFESKHVRKDGETFDALVELSSGRTGAGRRFRIATVQDVTEIHRLEEHLRQNQKLEALGTLAGGVAHEFNNVLLMISLSAELLEVQAGDSGPAARPCREILDAVGRGRSLVQQILAFSRRDPPTLRDGDLVPVVREAVRLVRPLTRSQIQIEVHIEPETAPCRFDTQQIHQILVNLVTNAAQAIGGSGEIHIGLAAAPAEASQDGGDGKGDAEGESEGDAERGRWLLTVRDDGPGMTPEVRQRIFEPFFTTKPAGEGTGLGLSVVYGIVQSHRGQIYAESEPGQGTEFRIELPIATTGAATERNSGPDAASDA